MKKGILFFVLLLCLALSVPVGAAAADRGKLLFIPQDNRPVSGPQAAEVLEKLGYTVVMPPRELLGGRESFGDPDGLWQWTKQQAPDVQTAVVSSDSLIYGSLVASRRHHDGPAELLQRAARLADFHQQNPDVKLYVFGSIMRTPSTGTAENFEEPDYYAAYGQDIYRYTAYADKKDRMGLTKPEEGRYEALQKKIPAAIWQDWAGRREKNLAVNRYLIDRVRQGDFQYFIFGCDDNAPLSRTHMERRQLAAYAAGLDTSRFQIMTGIDEMAMLLLSRAASEQEGQLPFVHVRYNEGQGGKTIPAYADGPIAKVIRAEVAAVGGMAVSLPNRADLVLLVNTNPDGTTWSGSDLAVNTTTPHMGTYYFSGLVQSYIDRGYPVAIADIACENGADNALMEQLRQEGLLFRLYAYGGWNTATNTSGFVLGEGVLAGRMPEKARQDLLFTRYLDDWAYQANVRPFISEQLPWSAADGSVMTLGSKRAAVEVQARRLLEVFVDRNMPAMAGRQEFQVTFPWNRMFEADIERTAK